MKKDNFTNKKVAVLGLGIEGEDLVRFLLARGAKITVFDQKEREELGFIYQKLEKREVSFKLGKDYLKESLAGFDYLFCSPGFKRSMPEIIEAEKKGTIISSATKLFFDLCPGKIIGVTGTKGKGTTATLAYQILKADGKDVFLAGNIGQPMLSLLSQIKPSSWVVLELSSFQLQDLDKSPHLGVVLFISSEHLDYHKDTKEYVQAKTNLLTHQAKNDFAVLNADDQTSSSFAPLTKAKTFYFSRKKEVKGAFAKKDKLYLFDKLIGKTQDLKIPGSHNWENVLAASLTAYLAGARMDSIKKAVFAFEGLEHRLELVKEIGGIKFYNDSFSTTPETTIAAIKAFKEPITLIAGGSEKGSDFSQLGRKIAKSKVKTLILIGEMAARIKQACQQANFKRKIIFRPKDMGEMVSLAIRESKSGEIVLLSPACASFDMFANYKERGNQFKKHVQAIQT